MNHDERIKNFIKSYMVGVAGNYYMKNNIRNGT